MATHADFQRRVQRYGWDKSAPHYEQFWKQALAPAQQQLLRMAALTPGEQVLDVACGTGLVTLQAAQAVAPEGQVIGTDLSDVMVAATADAAARAGLTNITTRRADAEVLPFADGSFDVALCALGMMYVPDPAKAFAELHRVLRPGGRCVVAVWGQRSRCGWAELFPIVDHRVTSEVCPMFFQLGGDDTLDQAMQAAGLTDVDSTRLDSPLLYDSADDACGAAFLGGPVAMAFARFDDATRAEVHTEYLASIAGYTSGSGYAIPGEFVVARGRKPS